ncbi:MAG: InlB B-repeat-containing protein [Lachnospiraceae bacterium]|nr:InlB B-repeat-containing protein [Lachnospiraceae bacterium]
MRHVRQSKIKLFASILLTAAALILGGFSCFAAEEILDEAAPEESVDGNENYNLWVGGQRITSGNKANIPGLTGGSGKYDPSTHTLTFYNVTGFEGTSEAHVGGGTVYAWVYTFGISELKIRGNVNITEPDDKTARSTCFIAMTDSDQYSTNTKMDIQGDFRLDVNGRFAYTAGTVTVDGDKTYIEHSGYACPMDCGTYIQNNGCASFKDKSNSRGLLCDGDVIVNGGDLFCHGGKKDGALEANWQKKGTKGIEIGTGLSILQPVGGTIGVNSLEHDSIFDGNRMAADVHIGKKTIKVVYKDSNGYAASALPLEGNYPSEMMSYNSSTNTLTLKKWYNDGVGSFVGGVGMVGIYSNVGLNLVIDKENEGDICAYDLHGDEEDAIYGVYVEGDLTIKNAEGKDTTLYVAIPDDNMSTNFDSAGIYCTGKLTIENADTGSINVQACGCNAKKSSYGIYARDGMELKGELVDVTAGEAKNGVSAGLFCEKIINIYCDVMAVAQDYAVISRYNENSDFGIKPFVGHVAYSDVDGAKRTNNVKYKLDENEKVWSYANDADGAAKELFLTDKYDVWVGNVQVTDDNLYDIPVGKGKAQYDPNKGILKLTNVKEVKGVTETVKGSGKTAFILSKVPLTITGSAELTSDAEKNYIVYSNKELGFEGNFDFEAACNCIYSNSKLSVKGEDTVLNATSRGEGGEKAIDCTSYEQAGGRVSATGGKYGVYATFSAVINGGELRASGGTAALRAGKRAIDELEIVSPIEIVKPAGGFVDEDEQGRYIYDDKGIAGSVIIADPATVTYTVTFDLGGKGSAIDPVSVNPGEKVEKPADPKAEGYVFEGWFADKELKTPYDFDAPVKDDLTIYAKWSTAPDPGVGGDKPITPGDEDSVKEKKSVTKNYKVNGLTSGSVISVSVNYMDAVAYTGKKPDITDKDGIAAKLYADELVKAALINGVKASELFTVKYTCKNKAAGPATFYAKLSLVKGAKKKFSIEKQQLKDIKKLIKNANKAFKADPCAFNINKAILADLKPITLKAKFNKDGSLAVKDGKPKKIKSVTVTFPGASKAVKLGKKMFSAKVVDEKAGTVEITGLVNFTGSVTVQAVK